MKYKFGFLGCVFNSIIDVAKCTTNYFSSFLLNSGLDNSVTKLMLLHGTRYCCMTLTNPIHEIDPSPRQ